MRVNDMLQNDAYLQAMSMSITCRSDAYLYSARAQAMSAVNCGRVNLACAPSNCTPRSTPRGKRPRSWQLVREERPDICSSVSNTRVETLNACRLLHPIRLSVWARLSRV